MLRKGPCLRQRQSVRAHARSIFQIKSGPKVSLSNAREAYNTCSHLTGESKRSCYECFGVDGDRVENYLIVVETLEDLYADKKKKKFEELWRTFYAIFALFIHLLFR